MGTLSGGCFGSSAITVFGWRELRRDIRQPLPKHRIGDVRSRRSKRSGICFPPSLQYRPFLRKAAKRRGGTVSENQEHLLVRIFELLRMHQEALFKANLSIAAAVEALKESDAQFGDAYDKAYWNLKQGRLGEENSTALRIIDQIKRELRPGQANSAG